MPTSKKDTPSGVVTAGSAKPLSAASQETIDEVRSLGQKLIDLIDEKIPDSNRYKSWIILGLEQALMLAVRALSR